MQLTTCFTLLAAFLTLASALPTDKRIPIKNVTCHPDNKYSGSLKVEDSTGSYSAGLTGVTATDSQGRKKKVLVTKNVDGTAVADQTFDFIPCDSDFMGYPDFDDGSSDDGDNELEKREDSDPVIIGRDFIVYGHLSLGGALKHCLQTKTGSVRSATTLTHSLCSFSDDKSQIQNFWAYNVLSQEISFVGEKFQGIHHPTSLSISAVKSKAVKLNPVDNDDGAYLKLTQPEPVEVIED